MAHQVTILGPIRVVRGEESIDPGPRQRRLLAALVLAEGAAVRADRLVDIVWGDDAPADATSSLKTTVARLRKSIADDANPIEFQSNGYALETSMVEIDSSTFETEMDEASRLLRLGETDDALTTIDRSLDRWRGEALDEFATEDWARPSAVRLTERRLEARDIRIQALIAVGRTEQAVAEAVALAEEEPLREGPAAALMRALHADGRSPDALRVVPAMRTRMIEVGLTPSPELLELEQDIASGTMARSATQLLRGYQLLERIGEGSNAFVHRALQPTVEREVAIKIIKPELADRPAFVRRFEVEARVAARVEHPNVVPLYDFWREPGAAYLVMRLMRGGSLGELLSRTGRLEPSRVIDLAQHVGAGLARAHAGGVVHRDVRPANILLDEHGHGYLADFGIAQLVDSAQQGPALSPAHAAPEVLAGAPAAIPADVLALGVTIFEMLVGDAPFADSPDVHTLIRRQINEPMPAVASVRPELGPAIDGVLQRATSKNPSERQISVERLVDEVTSALSEAAEPGSTALAWHRTEAINPYRGLRRFDEADAENFYGRDATVDGVIEILATAPFVTVVGPSGSGKSSLVRAGVIPKLRSGGLPGSERWFITTVVPGHDPFRALEAALLRIAVDPPSSLNDALQEQGGIERAVQSLLPEEDGVALLVIDQFEELFTLTDEATRTRFIDELCQSIETTDRLRVIATIRADHLDGPLGVRALSDHLAAATILLGPIPPAGLERAIVEPAASVGVVVEPALVAELVSATADRPSALPLLQFTLSEIFEQRTSQAMTIAAYRDLGGIEGALQERAEKLVADRDIRRAARHVFSRLVTLSTGSEPTRRRAPLSEFDDRQESLACIEAFGDARLVAFDHDAASGASTVEVTHEALLSGWGRLGEWIETDRADLIVLRRVTDASASFARSDFDEGELGRGLFLDQATELRERRPELLSESEKQWIDASSAARAAELAEKERVAAEQVAANRRLRRLLTLAAGLLVVAVAASAIALVLRGQANDRAEEARQATDDALLGRLVAESGAQLDSAPDLAALLALEAFRQADTLETRGALLRAVSHDPTILGIVDSPVDEAATVSFDQSGSTGLAWVESLETGRLQRFDPRTGEVIGDPVPLQAPPTAVLLSGDGLTIATADRSGTVRVITATDERTFDVGFPVFWGSIDHNGSTVLLEGPDAVVALSLGDGSERWRLERDPTTEVFGDTAVAANGSVAAVLVSELQSDNNETTRIVYIDEIGTEINRSELHFDAIRIAIAPDGSLVATGGLRGDIVLHDPTTDERVARAVTGVDIAQGVAVRNDGRAALSGANGLVVSFEPWLERPTAVDVSNRVLSLAIGDDATVVASTPEGRVWNIDPSRTSFEALRIPARFANVPRAGHLFNTAGEDFRSTNYHRISDGEIISTIEFDPAFGAVGRYPETSPHGGWFFSYNETFEVVAVAQTLDEQQILLDVEELLALLGRSRADGDFQQIEVDDDGMLFVVAGKDGDAVAAWVDPRNLSIQAGPVQVGDIPWSLILPDGSVVIGSPSIPLSVLSPDLDEPPLVLLDETGFGPRDVTPDGRIIAGDLGRRVVLVDPVNGDVTDFAGIDGQLFDVRVSPDGSIVALRYPDSVALFDLETLTLIGQPTPMDSANASTPGMSFQEEGTLLYLNSAEAISAVEVDHAAWFERACALANRTMTEAEWRTFVSPDTDVIDACA